MFKYFRDKKPCIGRNIVLKEFFDLYPEMNETHLRLIDMIHDKDWTEQDNAAFMAYITYVIKAGGTIDIILRKQYKEDSLEDCLDYNINFKDPEQKETQCVFAKELTQLFEEFKDKITFTDKSYEYDDYMLLEAKIWSQGS